MNTFRTKVFLIGAAFGTAIFACQPALAQQCGSQPQSTTDQSSPPLQPGEIQEQQTEQQQQPQPTQDPGG
ncbi:MAG TPA: hypothetical protein VGG48_13535 [Rhizomicrobium sp.]|jgi:hypothetical protein